MSDSEPPTMAYPDPLERIFLQVEEENEMRAQQEESNDRLSSIPRVDSSDNLKKGRRRGSISITRFGQVDNPSASESSTSGPTTPALSDIASKSPFYQAQLKSQNGSQTSFASYGTAGNNGDDDLEDDHHVTHVHTIAPRQMSISRAVGGLLPRRRPSVLPTSSRDAGDSMVISVAAATVELPENSEPSATVVQALNHQTSKSSMASTNSKTSWAARAKEFSKKFRRKSKMALTERPHTAS
ncbi:hypothetical protein FB45DRAFT_68107 [Roridomyces roridus]|uniref:Uncharacterized protein n=1 Tax=Roridomyces roridus TaxID=1738132 RepID=A0AAD7BMS2_9AGAR|nr:hypothetical protein FB45DRAFT_68107 [Roridomyces roridus]